MAERSTTHTERMRLHRQKMLAKAQHRDAMHAALNNSRRLIMLRGMPSSINRHTGKPHEHKREIARRLRQAERNAAK